MACKKKHWAPAEALSIAPKDLANASHELRTPLSALLMAVEILQTTRLDSSQQELVNVAVDATKDLASLVDELVDTTRVGHLSGQPTLQRVDPYTVISQVLNSLSALAREKSRWAGILV